MTNLRIDVINLDRSADRLAEFAAVNRHLSRVGRWSAIDGTTLDPSALVAEGVIGPEIASRYSQGSLGLALSHLALWKKCSETGRPITVCEDDAIFHRGFEHYAGPILERLPGESHLILWGWNFDVPLVFDFLPGVSPCQAIFDQTAMRSAVTTFQTLPLSPQPFRLLFAFGTLCYTIFPAGADALRRRCLPISGEKFFFPALERDVPNYGIDIMMANLYPRLAVFVCFPPLVVSRNDPASSLTVDPAAYRS